MFLFPKVALPVDEKTFMIQKIADQNWRDSWKASFQPIFVRNALVVLPPWEEPEKYPYPHKVFIDPGMAFGTGQHETTRLCLQYLVDYPMPHKVLDVGTGSGILAIVAALRGAQHVFALDLDETCIPVAKENAERNGCSQIHFFAGALKDYPESLFPLILANIQSKPLLTLLHVIFEKLAPLGICVLSGILVSEKKEFIEQLEEKNFLLHSVDEQGDWCCIVASKK
jgi:ribosomal protein L11 methyltransferase